MINVVCLVRVSTMSARGDGRNRYRWARRAERRQLNKHSRFAGYGRVQAINNVRGTDTRTRTHACTTRRARVEFRSRVNATRRSREANEGGPSDRFWISQSFRLRILDARFLLYPQQRRRFTGFPAVVSRLQWCNSSISSRKNNCHASVIIRAWRFCNLYGDEAIQLIADDSRLIPFAHHPIAGFTRPSTRKRNDGATMVTVDTGWRARHAP